MSSTRGRDPQRLEESCSRNCTTLGKACRFAHSVAREAWEPRSNRSPEGQSTQNLRCLVSKTINSMVLGTRYLKCWVRRPSGSNCPLDCVIFDYPKQDAVPFVAPFATAGSITAAFARARYEPWSLIGFGECNYNFLGE